MTHTNSLAGQSQDRWLRSVIECASQESKESYKFINNTFHERSRCFDGSIKNQGELGVQKVSQWLGLKRGVSECNAECNVIRQTLTTIFFCVAPPNTIALHYVHCNYMHFAHMCMMHCIWPIMQIKHDWVNERWLRAFFRLHRLAATSDF